MGGLGIGHRRGGVGIEEKDGEERKRRRGRRIVKGREQGRMVGEVEN